MPVATHPAVLAPRVGQHARGEVVHQLDVGDERAARVQALEQIVREKRVLRHATLERGGEGVDVVESLTREAPLAEQVLIRVRDRGRVGVDAGVPGIGARERRAGGARERDADPRLEDPVALDDAPQLGVEARAVERVLADPDQAPRRFAWEMRVAVERDAVADAGQGLRAADLLDEVRVGGST